MSKQNYILKTTGQSVLLAIVLTALGMFLVNEFTANSTYATVTSSRERPLNTLRDLNQAYIDIADQTRPTVVTVSTDRVMQVENTPFANNPLFDFFFHQQPGQQAPEQRQYHQKGLGSGVIVSDDGLILTNNHVVDGADSIYVRTYAGDRYKAEVVGVDPKTDVAVLRIPAKNLTPILIGNSDSLQVGEIVLAVGSPMSVTLAYTVTQGIVSAKGRSNVGLADYEDFIQTDAAINPGNSGGPLVNLDGQLVGLNAAIISQSGGFQGIGFAVPSNMAKQIMNSLLTEGRVVRGYLGVTIQDISDAIASAMGVETTTGALVGDVVSDSPADKAGLASGDIITEAEGHPIHNAADLRNIVAGTKPGTTVQLKVLREGKEKSVQVTLGELPSEMASTTPGGSMSELLGFQVSNLTKDMARRLGIEKGQTGVVVTSIDQNSNAAQAGLREGDLIVQADQQRVNNVNDFDSVASQKRSGDSLLLRVERNGSMFFLAFQL
jgi:serine protease Do